MYNQHGQDHTQNTFYVLGIYNLSLTDGDTLLEPTMIRTCNTGFYFAPESETG